QRKGTRACSRLSRRLQSDVGRRQRDCHEGARQSRLDRGSRRGTRHGRTDRRRYRGMSLAVATKEGDEAMRERRCIVSGEVLPEGKIIRFVVGPGGVITPDVAAK